MRTPIPAAAGAALALCAALAGCNDRAEPGASQSAPAETAGAPPAPEPTPAANSIMRAEVVAETEPAAPPPVVLQPIRRTVGFPEGGSTLDPAARAALDALVGEPATAAGGAITIRGHTDSRGNDEANLRSSERRAQAVRDYLAGKGVAEQRMTVIPLGETRPVAPNANLDGSDDEAGRARNRRAVVEVALPAPPAPAEADTADGNAAANARDAVR